MASARIVNRYPDGSSTEMAVTIKADGPDALDEAVRRVIDLWRECVAAEPEAEDQA